MARLPRLAIAEQLHYVCQTGHSGSNAFRDEHDARAFVETLSDAALRYPVHLHAYMVLPDRYGLLVTPLATGALSVFVQAIGRSYARHFNKRHQRSGTLWNGRFLASVLEAGAYHNDVMTWMALQSSHARVATGWPLSMVGSAPHYLGEAHERWITPHAMWWATGNTPFERESAFGHRLQAGLSDGRIDQLNRTMGRDWVLGNPEFLSVLAGLTDRRLTKGNPGRPRVRRSDHLT